MNIAVHPQLMVEVHMVEESQVIIQMMVEE